MLYTKPQPFVWELLAHKLADKKKEAETKEAACDDDQIYLQRVEETFLRESKPFWTEGRMIPDWKCLRRAFGMELEPAGEREINSSRKETAHVITTHADQNMENFMSSPFIQNAKRYGFYEKMVEGDLLSFKKIEDKISKVRRFTVSFFREDIEALREIVFNTPGEDLEELALLIFDEERNPIHMAASLNYSSFLRQFFQEHRTKIDAKQSMGLTPLMTASLYGSSETISLLLSMGADPNKVTPLGETALFLAVRAGHLKSACLLVGGGADLSRREENSSAKDLEEIQQAGNSLSSEPPKSLEELISTITFSCLEKKSKRMKRELQLEEYPMLQLFIQKVKNCEMILFLRKMVKEYSHFFPSAFSYSLSLEGTCDLSDASGELAEKFEYLYLMRNLLGTSFQYQPEDSSKIFFMAFRILESSLEERDFHVKEGENYKTQMNYESLSLLRNISPDEEFYFRLLQSAHDFRCKARNNNLLLQQVKDCYYKPGSPGAWKAVNEIASV